MVAARAHLVQEVIRPALAAGRIVVADRFALSTEAYQGAGRGLPAGTIRAVNEVATGGLAPDLTLVIDIPPAVGQARQIAAGKDQDRLDREAPDFHARVAAHYLAAGGPGVRHLDGTREADSLLRAALAELADVRPEPFGMLAG
jgi:dTMP kinase